MKNYFCALVISLPLLHGCSADNNEDKIKANPINTNKVVSSENTKSEASKKNQEQFFILAKDVKFDKDLAQLEAIWQGHLTLHNNCLSIVVKGDKETVHTLVVPKEYEILFDKQQNIIGLKNIKSKEQYKLGEPLQFGGIAFDKEKMKLNKNLPTYCEPRLALPGDIKK